VFARITLRVAHRRLYFLFLVCMNSTVHVSKWANFSINLRCACEMLPERGLSRGKASFKFKTKGR
jgi:hypothetical protein